MLERQVIAVPFAQGIDSKTDPKQLSSGKVSRAENVVFDRIGEVSPRDGFQQTVLALPYGSGVTWAGSLNGVPVCGHGIDVYKSVSGTFVQQTGVFKPASVTETRLDSSLDGEVSGKVSGFCDVAVSSTGRVLVSQTNENNYSTLKLFVGGELSKSISFGTGVARVLWAAGSWWVLGYRSSAIRLCRLDARTLSVVAESIMWASPLTTDAVFHFDLCTASTSLGDVIYIAGCENVTHIGSPSTPTVVTHKIFAYENGVVKSAGPTYTMSGVSPGCHGFCVWATPGEVPEFLIASLESATGDKDDAGLVFRGGMTSRELRFEYDGDPPTYIHGTWVGSGRGSAVFLSKYETLTWPVSRDRKTTVYNVEWGSSAFTYRVGYTDFGVGVSGRPIVVDEVVYAPASHFAVSFDSDFPSDFFVALLGLFEKAGSYAFTNASFKALPLAVLAKEDSALPSGPHVRGSAYYNGSFYVPAMRRGMQSGIEGEFTTSLGLFRVDTTFRPKVLEVDGSLLIPGAVPQFFDGETCSEFGFLTSAVAPKAVDSKLDGTNSYNYVTVFCWTDAHGQQHRSAPSIPLSRSLEHQISGAYDTEYALQPPPFTNKLNPYVELYRTKVASSFGSGYFLVGRLAASRCATEVINDGLSDEELEAREALYSSDNTLENSSPPACSMFVAHRQRIFCDDSLTKGQVWFTKKIIPGQGGAPGMPPEFSAYLTLSTDVIRPGVVGLASLDEKLVILSETGLHFIVGDGPDQFGGQNDYGDPIPIPSDCGCVYGRSVLTCSDGVYFQSARGIYMVDRGLTIQYVGREVEQQVLEAPITQAFTQLSSPRRVFVQASLSRALVFDTLVGQWATWHLNWNETVDSQISIVEAFDDAGLTHVVCDSGACFTQVPESAFDVSVYTQSAISMFVETGWVRVAQLLGFQRCRRVMVLGQYESPHSLYASVAFDDDAATWLPGLEMRTTSGSAGSVIQWRIDVPRQKCQAIKLRLYTEPAEGNFGKGCRLSSLTFELGVKKGTAKLSSDKVVG